MDEHAGLGPFQEILTPSASWPAPSGFPSAITIKYATCMVRKLPEDLRRERLPRVLAQCVTIGTRAGDENVIHTET